MRGWATYRRGRRRTKDEGEGGLLRRLCPEPLPRVVVRNMKREAVRFHLWHVVLLSVEEDEGGGVQAMEVMEVEEVEDEEKLEGVNCPWDVETSIVFRGLLAMCFMCD